MSDAVEPDLAEYLSQARVELEHAIGKRRAAATAEMAARGMLQSSGAIRKGIASLEEMLLEHWERLADVPRTWAGPQLPVARVRQLVARHLRECADQLISVDCAYPIARKMKSEAAINAMERELDEVRAKLHSRTRALELGAGTQAIPAQPTTVNIVHAGNVIGGIQQAGHESSQIANVALSAETIGSALEHLSAVLEGVSSEIRAQIEPDAATIRSQLEKPTPNPTIVQEAGRSVRTIVEGALGGAIGGAASPSVVSALGALSAALWIG